MLPTDFSGLRQNPCRRASVVESFRHGQGDRPLEPLSECPGQAEHLIPVDKGGEAPVLGVFEDIQLLRLEVLSVTASVRCRHDSPRPSLACATFILSSRLLLLLFLFMATSSARRC